ncbi:hypothetical protein D7Z54_23465 [Salibacterium salarium]|uniref:YceG-like family protein n=2 Tax=Salibacterium salarium TaxID=284579 RepID=A0A3R9P1P5_9BACI|nr:hypothetical protein D7Z54_23465 [Salibacterium salarium]
MNRKSIQVFAFGWFAAACCIGLFYFFAPSLAHTDDTKTQETQQTPEPLDLEQLDQDTIISFLESKEFTVLNDEEREALEKSANDGQEDRETDETDQELVKAILHIEEGMTSKDVASLLNDLEMINDTPSFEQELTKKEAATTIQPGFHELTDEMSATDIIERITS